MKYLILALALIGCGSSDVYTQASLSLNTDPYFVAVEDYFGINNLSADIVHVNSEEVCGAQACMYNNTVYYTENVDEQRRCRQIIHELGHVASKIKFGDADASHHLNTKFFLEYVFDFCDSLYK